MSLDSLLEAVQQNAADCPCDRCALREHCAQEACSCHAFRTWVNTGRVPKRLLSNRDSPEWQPDKPLPRHST